MVAIGCVCVRVFAYDCVWLRVCVVCNGVLLCVVVCVCVCMSVYDNVSVHVCVCWRV